MAQACAPGTAVRAVAADGSVSCADLGAAGVSSANSLAGAVMLEAGANVTIAPSATDRFAVSAAASGDVTGVSAGEILEAAERQAR